VNLGTAEEMLLSPKFGGIMSRICWLPVQGVSLAADDSSLDGGLEKSTPLSTFKKRMRKKIW